jgi:hypothetical protein
MICPSFALFLVICILDSTLSVVKNLPEVLRQVAGVFDDSNLVEKYHLEKTVVVAAANYGYLNHLYNFDCFAKRLGMKYLVMSLDEKAHHHIISHTKLVSYYFHNSNVSKSSDQEQVGTEAASFRSKQFNLISTRKNEAVYEIMSLEYDILFSDTDVAIIENPFPYLLWEGVDYVHSLNNPCEM